MGSGMVVWRGAGGGVRDQFSHRSGQQKRSQYSTRSTSSSSTASLRRLQRPVVFAFEWPAICCAKQGDANEQRETFEVLRRSLDEGRPAGYELFS